MNNVLTKKFAPKLNLIEFTEDSQMFVQEYSCPLCEGILNESVIDKCGHSYCRECIEVLLLEKITCPFTNKEIVDNNYKKNKDIFSYLSNNIVVNSVIEKQKVYCKNRSASCEWIGKLIDRKTHLLHDCEKELVGCEYSDECKVSVTRDQMAVHMQECPYRIVLCHHCQQYVSFNSVEAHYKSCPNFPVQCTGGCGSTIPTSQLQVHIELHCDNTIVECPFNVVGCSFIEIRKELKVHLNDTLEQHLKMISKKIKSLEDVVSFQKSQLVDLQKENEQIKSENEATKDIISKNQEDVLNSIDILAKNIENLKLYSSIPQSNYLPNYFDYNLQINSSNYSQIREILKIDNENNTISKIQENYGWYGISTEPFDLTTNLKQSSSFQSNRIIVNMKILKTSNSCIMFGITYSSLNSPLKNGFYSTTDEENISYMFFTYNCSFYCLGRSSTVFSKEEGNKSCVEGDVITMIIDYTKNMIMFRRNGTQIIGVEVPFQEGKAMRVAVDLCDYQDQIQFLV